MDAIGIILLIVCWVVLQKWLLPRLGVSTWMSPNVCRGSAEDEDNPPPPKKEDIISLED